jgi:hypothetical protein
MKPEGPLRSQEHATGQYPESYESNQHLSPSSRAMRLSLTAATDWPIVNHPHGIWVCRVTVKWYWQGKTEELGEKPVPVPPCPSQILHGLSRARSRASAVTGRRLTAWAMARPSIHYHAVTVRSISKSHKIIYIILLYKWRSVQHPVFAVHSSNSSIFNSAILLVAL